MIIRNKAHLPDGSGWRETLPREMNGRSGKVLNSNGYLFCLNFRGCLDKREFIIFKWFYPGYLAI